MRRIIVTLIIGVWCFNNFARGEIDLSKDIYNRTDYSPIYKEQGALVRNIPFPPVNALIKQIEKSYPGLKLKDRGEAHITVITPPEYQTGLKKAFSPDQIHEFYKDIIQDTLFEIVCIGKWENKKDKNMVFFLVVKANNLFEIRRNLLDKAIREGKDPGFDPENFYPHITIGFAKSDIHNIKKDESSCDKNLNLVIK